MTVAVTWSIPKSTKSKLSKLGLFRILECSSKKLQNLERRSKEYMAHRFLSAVIRKPDCAFDEPVRLRAAGVVVATEMAAEDICAHIRQR